MLRSEKALFRTSTIQGFRDKSTLESEEPHLAKGEPPSQEELEQMTKDYQEKIRQSPMWDEMVKKYGLKKAEELLKQCKAELG